jgi:hypothetical protein
MRKSKIFKPIRYSKEEKMNHNKFVIRAISFILVTLVVAGCAAPTATPCPTAVPQSCPTAAKQECPTAAIQSCPTTAAQAMPERDTFRSSLGWNVIFTFDPGDKCSMKIIHQPSTAEFQYEIVVNDQAHLNYMVYGGTLNPGATIAEVEEYNRLNPNTRVPPPMMTMQLYNAVNPMSTTLNLVTYTGDPIYFSCLTEGPDEHQVIASFDPLVMPTK